MNRSTTLWGPDAKEFKPERWIGEQGIPAAAKDVQGHRHLLTFIDGPRTCLGKGFAITEFKVCAHTHPLYISGWADISCAPIRFPKTPPFFTDRAFDSREKLCV